MNKSSTLLLGVVALAVATISYYELSSAGSSPSTSGHALPPGDFPPENSPFGSGRSQADTHAEENGGDSPTAGPHPSSPARTAAVGRTAREAQGKTATAPSIAEPTGGPALRPASDGATVRPATPVAAPALVFQIPAELQIPAVLMATDPALELSPSQEDLKRELTGQFLQIVKAGGKAAAGAASESAVAGETWADAQAWADARFRKLFGDDAFQRQILNGAKVPLEAPK